MFLGSYNFLFGRPGESAETLAFEAPGALELLNSENRPVDADVQYDNQLEDYLDAGSGWLAKAFEVLATRAK